jgi:hypothetical protein
MRIYPTKLAIIFLILVACSKKNETSPPEKLTNTMNLAAGDTDADSTGLTGLAGCYYTYMSTVRDPDFENTGEAESELADCSSAYNPRPGGDGHKLYPPPPDFPDTRYYPDEIPLSIIYPNDNSIFTAHFKVVLSSSTLLPLPHRLQNLLIKEKVLSFNAALVKIETEILGTKADNLGILNEASLFKLEAGIYAYILNYPDSPIFTNIDLDDFRWYVTDLIFHQNGRVRISNDYANALGVWDTNFAHYFNVLIPSPPF